MSYRVDIKPLSVNSAFKGQRFRTKEYDVYERALMFLLPRKLVLPEPNYSLFLIFGLSSKLADADNPTKLFTDILAKKYGFNDKLIFEFHIVKKIVPKGKEFIEFSLVHYYSIPEFV